MSEITKFSSAANPAHSIEAEQQVLGLIMLDNAAFDSVSDILGVEHFHEPLHQRVFEICGKRIVKGHLVSPVTMAAYFQTDEALAQVGGPKYFVRMAGAATSKLLVRDYAKLIVEHAVRRRLQEASTTALSALHEGGESGDVKMGLLQALHALPEVSGEESSYSMARCVDDAVKRAVSSYHGEVMLLKTGIPTLDRVIKGLAPGDLCLIGGATSMGKTSLALEIAANVAMKQGKNVAFVSLEMSREDLVTRMASAVARVPYTDLRDASQMQEDDFRKWLESAQSIAEARMRIIPKHIRDIPGIHAAVNRVKREFGGSIDVLIVDYTQLVRGTGKSRFEQMTEVSIGLKSMGWMLDAPVIGLVQLSRQIGERDDKRPQLGDIKETGQFENDADQVIFCHRESYWMERQGPKANAKGEVTDQVRIEWAADLAAVKNVMELIVRKNRHGRLATAQIGFHDATNRFWELGQRDDVQEDMF